MESLHRPDNNQNSLYPVFLKLVDLEIAIVGGGNVALEKLNSILSNSPQTRITVIAPKIKSEILSLAQTHSINVIERKFEEYDLLNKSLIFCATDDQELHKHIKSLASELHLLVNVADTPDLCDFYLASIVQKGNLKIAISTNGLSPTGARRIKETLQDVFPESIDQVLRNLNQIRNNLKGNFEYKIKKMNEVTALMGLSQNQIRNKSRLKILWSISIVLLSILVGYLIGNL